VQYYITIGKQKRYLTPPVDIYETKAEVAIIADMPGTSKDSIDVNVVDNRLTIEGHFQADCQGTRLIRECPNNDYYRAFKLSNAIDVDNIKAKISDGVLKVILPKKTPQRQEILIEVE